MTSESRGGENQDSDVEQLVEMTVAAQAGDRRASEELIPLLYDELRRIARALFSRRSPGQTLQPTALVNEACLKIFERTGNGWEGTGHFVAAAAQAMRQILVDEARRKSAIKRGGPDRKRVPLEEGSAEIEAPDGDLVALNEALQELEKIEPRQSKVVTMRYFAGLTVEETASALDVSVGTVERDWRFAKSWLFRELGQDG